MDALIPGPGHNRAPDPIALLTLELEQSNEPLIERQAELLGMEARLPAAEAIDDDWAVKLSDAIKSCTAFVKNSEAARVSAKEPHLAAGRAVDGFFGTIAAPVEKLKAKMGALLTTFQRKKADEERRAREAAAAEAKRIADEQERIRREEARRLAEAKRKEDEAKREAERLEREATDKAAREAAAAARAEADRLAAQRATQEAAAAEAKGAADMAKMDAHTTKADATVKAADLTRTRSTLGSVASLRTTWAFELEDLDLVPQQYLSLNEGAVRAAIKSATTRDGKCKLVIPGVRIYAKEESVVR